MFAIRFECREAKDGLNKIVTHEGRKVWVHGDECKKTDCIHYPYRNNLFAGHVSFCRECRWAYKSQWVKIV